MASDTLPMPSFFSGVDVIIDDSSEDACCICFEPFSSIDPLTATKCKHDYHLHCILEWSQRSNECPICSQRLILKDPVSQELLAGVESDKNLRLRRNSNPINRDNEVNNDESHVDVYDIEQRIARQFAAVAARARSIRRRRQSTLSAESSQNHTVPPAAITSNATESNSSLQEHQPIVSFRSPTDIESSRSKPENSGKSTSSDFVAFSESLKSKISSASAKYKESISKSTRGIKEKLAAHNDSVKELSKGVQREMSAGISKMFERLDITQKRAGTSIPRSSPLEPKAKRDDKTISKSIKQQTGELAGAN